MVCPFLQFHQQVRHYGGIVAEFLSVKIGVFW